MAMKNFKNADDLENFILDTRKAIDDLSAKFENAKSGKKGGNDETEDNNTVEKFLFGAEDGAGTEDEPDKSA
jgi:hypothetical protein